MIGSFRGLSLILTHLTFRGASELQAYTVTLVFFASDSSANAGNNLTVP